MVTGILAALGVYLLHLFAPVLLFLPTEGIASRLGARDDLPKEGAVVGRLRRAAENYKESLFLFIPLALLALIVPLADQGQAVLGAQIFVVARLAYMIAYAAFPFLLRSLTWTVGLIGLGVMATALF